MRQYVEQKQQVGDAILLFRMGDFYELFYEDARIGAKLLGITLTSRDGGRTPLAGIPHHALENYLGRLVAAGHKVAISEQVEDASQAKGVIRRSVVRIVTPGTLTDEALLQRTRSNVVAAVAKTGAEVGVAWLELSSGQFVVQTVAAARVVDELCRIAPAEVLLAEGSAVGRDPLEPDIRDIAEASVTYRPAADFQPRRAQERLEHHFETVGLEGFGFDAMDASLQAAGALLAYVQETQKSAIRHLRPPRRLQLSEFLILDPSTLRSLEVERTLRTGARDGSLLAAVDRAANPMGARLLRHWLCYPLRDVAAIARRQRAIEALRTDEGALAAIRRELREIGDIERMVGRLGVLRTHPRDLRGLGNGLARLRPLRDFLRNTRCGELDDLAEQLEGLDDLAGQLCAALLPDAPATVREGGIFAPGHHPEVDRLRLFATDGQRWLAEFQAREVQRTGINSLKVAFNKVFGFYIEISNANRDRVPADYIRRQTVKSAERYITDELKRHEADALSAEARVKELEHELFLELRDRVAHQIPRLQQACAAIARLDVLAGWADLSLRRRYCRPEFVDEPVLEIDEGRHPVVEQTLEANFVPNDARLIAVGGAPEGAAKSLALITGPNMAGKSTYIRQVALLTLLAHCGCWVPAKRMRLGVCDRVFTRVGAADELARGQSTFMVEMLETANILHNATRASLVILDEVGRGTSTYDGLSLAWAITEHLAARVGCRALFATHYHELTELAELIDSVANLNVAVREYEDQVVFLHRIIAGAADRSYGLHVAKLAGVPREVLERANSVLNELEKTFSRESQRPVLAAVQRRRQRQLRLFETPEETVVRELRDLPAEGPPEQLAAAVTKWRKMLGLP
ncbi:MAG: DNA mismatch repair protein MutS [Phycisphaerales bacterium]|nr:DNA mismatch repair protein MutS [Phycisphaerales bacterium]